MTVPLREAPTEPVAQRASDADREQAARTIHDAAGVGMLRLDETEERLTAVYAARFRPELSALVADLPVAESRPGTGRTFADWLRQLAALLVTLVVAAAGWARQHRAAAVLIGLVVGGLVVALVVAFGVDAAGGEHGADLVEN
ncbi:MAG: DUF1707 domain-containing protein [Mycobacteriaceae bacterium]